MREALKFYVDGEWVNPANPTLSDVINPATERPAGQINLGNAIDVDRAVSAAKTAFPAFAATSREERIALFERIIEQYRARRSDLVSAVSDEIGAPLELAKSRHVLVGLVHLKTALDVLRTFRFEEVSGSMRIIREPIGVCGLITPWNWPLNQIAAKVAPALACGCTMVLKPSEISPFSATIWAEIMAAAEVPPGVFNMVHGLGPEVGAAISSHPDVDMVSFTGSTRAGIDVALNAAPSIKRVHQELGGKSASIILPDADLDAAVRAGVKAVTANSGQSCNAPTRMLVPADRMADAARSARAAAEELKVGDPTGTPDLGPVASKKQFDAIQTYIERGQQEGATLAAGGVGRPAGIDRGFFVRPTVFADVTNDMSIAQEEIFGPVLAIIGYDSVDHAIRIANDSPYGLAGYIQGKDPTQALEVARRLRVGQVNINHSPPNPHSPFGGYKQSGNGREWGEHGFEGYLEVKAILGDSSVQNQALELS